MLKKILKPLNCRNVVVQIQVSRKGQNGPRPWNRNGTSEYSLYNKDFLFVVLYWVEINADEIKQILHTTLK